MKFMTDDECRVWCEEHKIALDDQGYPTHDIPYIETRLFEVPEPTASLLTFCRFIEEALQPREDCLVWASASDIFSTSRDLHLYYRLRQSYGDFRLLDDAPGHYFLGYESADLISFVAMAVMLAWDVHITPTMGYCRAFLSHDGWIRFASYSKHELPTAENWQKDRPFPPLQELIVQPPPEEYDEE